MENGKRSDSCNLGLTVGQWQAALEEAEVLDTEADIALEQEAEKFIQSLQARPKRCNMRPVGRGNSKYTGVRQVGNKWRACCSYKNKNYHLGYFDDEKEAAGVYDYAARKLFGNIAYTNAAAFPEDFIDKKEQRND